MATKCPSRPMYWRIAGQCAWAAVLNCMRVFHHAHAGPSASIYIICPFDGVEIIGEEHQFADETSCAFKQGRCLLPLFFVRLNCPSGRVSLSDVLDLLLDTVPSHDDRRGKEALSRNHNISVEDFANCCCARPNSICACLSASQQTLCAVLWEIKTIGAFDCSQYGSENSVVIVQGIRHPLCLSSQIGCLRLRQSPSVHGLVVQLHPQQLAMPGLLLSIDALHFTNRETSCQNRQHTTSKRLPLFEFFIAAEEPFRALSEQGEEERSSNTGNDPDSSRAPFKSPSVLHASKPSSAWLKHLDHIGGAPQ